MARFEECDVCYATRYEEDVHICESCDHSVCVTCSSFEDDADGKRNRVTADTLLLKSCCPFCTFKIIDYEDLCKYLLAVHVDLDEEKIMELYKIHKTLNNE